MKYKYILILAGIIALACTKEEEIIEGGSDEIAFEVNATIVGTGTKTVMGDLETQGSIKVYPINWSAGDKIGLVSGSTVKQITLTGGIGTNKGTFGGDASQIVIPQPGTLIYPAAYPPEKAFAEVSGDEIFVGSYLPVKQTFKDGSFGDYTYPMAAASTDGINYNFYNLAGVIQLQIRGNNLGDTANRIRAIYITGNKDEVLAGGIGMSFDKETGNRIETSSVLRNGPDGFRYKIDNYGSEGYERVIVDFQGGYVQLSPEAVTTINIAVLPQTLENGFTVEMVDASNMGSTFQVCSEALTIARSTVKVMEEFTYAQGEALQIANSYIYSDAGYYIMPAYCMGNRLDVPIATAGRNLGVDLLWSDLVKDGVTGETPDRNNLLPAVTNIEYLPFTDGNGMLQFKINTDPATGEAYRGNAAIALYDKDTKEILWSWHLWMCEPVYDVITGGSCIAGSYSGQYPDGTPFVYAGEAASGNMVVMDRNLGAISADPADGWKTYGLYYQNGRRDPFIGGHWNGKAEVGSQTAFTCATKAGGDVDISIRIDEDTPFSTATTGCWYNSELAPDGWDYHVGYQTISQSLSHPMMYTSAYEWYGTPASGNAIYSGGSSEIYGNGQWTWYEYDDNKKWLDNNVTGNTTGAHGNTGLSDGGHQAYWNRTKTIMDPCPVGYSVLGDKAQGGGAHAPYYEGYTKAGGGGEDKVTLIGNDTYKIGTYGADGTYGMISVHNGYYTWWPAAGVRTVTGKMGGVGYQGLYFHYDHINATHGGHGTSFSKGGFNNDAKSNHAGSVRCIREKQNTSTYPIKANPNPPITALPE